MKTALKIFFLPFVYMANFSLVVILYTMPPFFLLPIFGLFKVLFYPIMLLLNYSGSSYKFDRRGCFTNYDKVPLYVLMWLDLLIIIWYPFYQCGVYYKTGQVINT